MLVKTLTRDLCFRQAAGEGGGVGGGGGVARYGSLYGETPPERSTLFRLQVWTS